LQSYEKHYNGLFFFLAHNQDYEITTCLEVSPWNTSLP
jgi:hypothetical protein